MEARSPGHSLRQRIRLMALAAVLLVAEAALLALAGSSWWAPVLLLVVVPLVVLGRATHDLDIGRGNADHVLVGPAGVFVIETKDWGGRFYPMYGRLMFNRRAAGDRLDPGEGLREPAHARSGHDARGRRAAGVRLSRSGHARPGGRAPGRQGDPERGHLSPRSRLIPSDQRRLSARSSWALDILERPGIPRSLASS